MDGPGVLSAPVVESGDERRPVRGSFRRAQQAVYLLPVARRGQVEPFTGSRVKRPGVLERLASEVEHGFLYVCEHDGRRYSQATTSSELLFGVVRVQVNRDDLQDAKQFHNYRCHPSYENGGISMFPSFVHIKSDARGTGQYDERS